MNVVEQEATLVATIEQRLQAHHNSICSLLEYLPSKDKLNIYQDHMSALLQDQKVTWQMLQRELDIIRDSQQKELLAIKHEVERLNYALDRTFWGKFLALCGWLGKQYVEKPKVTIFSLLGLGVSIAIPTAMLIGGTIYFANYGFFPLIEIILKKIGWL